MLNTLFARRGMVTAPHHLASQAGLAILREGGNAAEAAIAAAATIATVYPHMNGIGGDGFWLMAEPGKEPIAIDACGRAAAMTSIEQYRAAGHESIPSRGPLAANTVAGTVGGWILAKEVAEAWGGRLAWLRLLEEAIHHAHAGVPLTADHVTNLETRRRELETQQGFADLFLPNGKLPGVGKNFSQPLLASTLERIGAAGPADFYRGELAAAIAEDLARAGSPLTRDDLALARAEFVTPLSYQLPGVTLFNLPPPTQGLASLLILAIYQRMGVREAESFEFLHSLVEATKQAFLLRDRIIADPGVMRETPAAFLRPERVAEMASAIDPARALPWPAPAVKGDTVWLGAIDKEGRAVSFIQSLYWEFGSGLVLPTSGILWQNRGSSFSLNPASLRALAPGCKPFHTLNPAMARFADGSLMTYGCMGGEGQPQTQAAIFARSILHGQGLQEAITRPRWLLGRTWGAETTSLKLENRFPGAVVEALARAGHQTEMLEPFSQAMGHAGALRVHKDGFIEGAADPRSDGVVAAF